MNALDVVLDWRPQSYGSKPARAIKDPIAEPLWTGIRVLGAAAGTQTSLQGVDGQPPGGFAHLAGALVTALGADDVVVDGYVTAEVAHGGTGTFTGGASLDSANSLITRNLLGTRPVSDEKRLDKGQAARMPGEDDPVALVLVDLLWLDGQSLLEVPLLERRRLLESVVVETDLVRCGVFVRPPIDTWIGSWRSMGFAGISLKAANGRYTPGASAQDWVSLPMPRR